MCPRLKFPIMFCARRLVSINSTKWHFTTPILSGKRHFSQTKIQHFQNYFANQNTHHGHALILGIETSCDDTGAAVVNSNGDVIGEALDSQTRIHIETGGILPPVARDLHKQNIESTVNLALTRAGMQLKDVDAVATTVEPGLIMSLKVGLDYTKKILQECPKPFIPIHHMEAHALTARMIHEIEFPFLVLLASGGHCLLAVVRGVNDFLLLGKGVDDAPGDAFDKTARSLKLKNIPELSGLSGGAAIEKLSEHGDPRAYHTVQVMGGSPNCNFSFAGIKSAMKRIIEQEEISQGLDSVSVLKNAPDICASFQYSVLQHLAKRVQRAMLFCDMKGLLPEHNRTLVMSGGVGSNTFIREGLERLCGHYDCQLICPPPKLCTDNGIMIAWNGIEKWNLGIGISNNLNAVNPRAKSPLGKDLTEEVEQCAIRLKRIKLLTN